VRARCRCSRSLCFAGSPAGAPPPPLTAAADSPLTAAAAHRRRRARGAGEFGAGQVRIFLLASLSWIPVGVVICIMVFMTVDPIKTKEWACVDPSDAACAAVYAAEDPGTAFCDLGEAPGGRWVWLNPSSSLLKEFGLVCSRAWLAQLANSAFFFGYLIGSGLFGSMADAGGRRRALGVSTAVTGVFTCLQTLGSAYPVYLVMRLMAGVGCAGARARAERPASHRLRGPAAAPGRAAAPQPAAHRLRSPAG
jgi:hypothetical protein